MPIEIWNMIMITLEDFQKIEFRVQTTEEEEKRLKKIQNEVLKNKKIQKIIMIILQVKKHFFPLEIMCPG